MSLDRLLDACQFIACSQLSTFWGSDARTPTMPSIGPTMPPHLASKRKRDEDDESSSSDEGPRPPSPNEGEKRRKVLGPTLPPAPLDERPTEAANSDNESSSDDDFGPAPPTAAEAQAASTSKNIVSGPSYPPDEEDNDASGSAQRDAWMLVPPKQDDLAARMDPTKLRARKFNSGKGAKGGGQGGAGGGIDAIWTETPEQKAKRLKDEMMGVSKPASGADAGKAASKREDEETARRIRDNLDKNRGKSLFEQHQKTSKAEDDDPSKRKFDYQKDMGSGGAQLGHSQKKEMLNRAKDFGSKFSGGSFL